MFRNFPHPSQFRTVTRNQVQETQFFKVFEFLIGEFDNLNISLR